ncbi:AcrB/AcrD/AcrF family protein [Sphingomonas sp. RP10(2022)]|uniref:AcrB/AcrD/AcrF family protein n=1 Tax=Sphingomonas liriopis TaxID=2949094 RepID=A0A9X2HTP3_9SPHN|nr:AcrB/AcrD/AcrF family protein [Sphingomonas liriopis]MCP3736367.1 AcrB/AcrD/AcrF family protein [Sphingomonas liriopis]
MNTTSRRSLDDILVRHWIALTLLAWAMVATWYVWHDWNMVRWLSLGDTDDNMRLMQVRAWLAGQPWYDLRNYRLNPPVGFDIHWSRIVDLPIAGLILFFRLFTSNAWAERLACGIAPLIPLSIAMLGVAATVRRLIHPLAWPLGVLFLLGTSATMLMFLPERIDHHGWQLAMLSLTVAGLCDAQGARGGLMVGLASAVSLSIGLEMLPYCAMAGAILTLRWVWERAEAIRLQAYALSLGGGSAIGFAAFASNANYAMRCDALTPVWLSVTVAAGALLFLMARLNPQARGVRIGLAVAAGAVIAAGFVHFFPQCLGRPEGVSPELQKNWLDNVREAKPIYKHPFRLGFPIAALPVVGVIGVILGTWRARRSPMLIGWSAVALFVTFACAMLLWQVRAGPAAQLLAVPGATLLGWIVLPWLLEHRSMPVRIGGTVAAFLIVSGLFAGLIIKYLPVDRPNAYTKRVNGATGSCVRYTVLKALDRYPAQTIFTFTDLGPRLITVTHHDAIAGPYHRNGDAILDVQHAFGRSADEAHAIIRRHGATMLLICPNHSESTNYRARNPGGFYDQLAHGQVPAWLTPLPLPRNSPLRLFKVD